MIPFPGRQHIKNIISGDRTPYTNEMMKKDIAFVTGRQLKILRKKHDISGMQLGKMLDISQQQVSRYENGMTPLPLDTIITICIYFHLSLREFLAPLMILTEDEDEHTEIPPLLSSVTPDIVTGPEGSFICRQQNAGIISTREKRRDKRRSHPEKMMNSRETAREDLSGGFSFTDTE
ncbi:helix-turn-helix transcriptional regulator [Morganella morganii]|nr:helix-turn-helix transcriptional regulator [Morganella morganii]